MQGFAAGRDSDADGLAIFGDARVFASLGKERHLAWQGIGGDGDAQHLEGDIRGDRPAGDEFGVQGAENGVFIQHCQRLGCAEEAESLAFTQMKKTHDGVHLGPGQQDGGYRRIPQCSGARV